MGEGETISEHEGADMSKVVVAGGSGFLGQHLVHELLRHRVHVVLLCRGTRHLQHRFQHFRIFSDDEAKTRCQSAGKGGLLQVVHCDLTTGFVHEDLREAATGAVALINLVGIKREEKHGEEQSFHGVHVNCVKYLLGICKELAIPRVVHVSVLSSRFDDREVSSYHHTKWKAEELILKRHEQGDFKSCLIVRPSVIWGRGDDTVRNLCRGMKHCAIFPLPGNGSGVQQPVHVSDVVRVVLESGLGLPLFPPTAESERGERDSVGECGEEDVHVERLGSGCEIIDVAGPKKMTVRELVQTAAEGVGLPTRIIPTPVAVVSLLCTVMGRLLSDPLITPAQLRMLVEGMHLEEEDGKESHGSEGKAVRHESVKGTVQLTPAAVADLEAEVPPLFGFSTRLLRTQTDQQMVQRRFSSLFPTVLFLVPVLLILFTSLVDIVPVFMLRLSTMHLVSVLLIFGLFPRAVLSMFHPTARGLGKAVLFALGTALLCMAGTLVLPFLMQDYDAQEQQLGGFWHTEELGTVTKVVLTTALLIPAEELLRAALMLSFAAFFSKRPALAHLSSWFSCVLASLVWGCMNVVTLGSSVAPVIFMASVIMGSLWSAMFMVNGFDLVSAWLFHVIWDAVMIWFLF
mmetsp:Transcript_20303/g.77732  ORF Transcript_20303/g.77732 Transcript_20303/m.77732 type:complete len:629 (-) Transcript_20303:43-1929(-)